jgi:alkanesulfonate monooxygenase SsuD/methylene tetrahydromethanopterin reductase-like flavin-dependent oxidoreductase (luciferase family)
MMAWPKPAQNPLPIIVGGAFPHAARRAVRYGNGWIPIAGRPIYGNFEDYFPQYKQMLAEAGRTLADAPISMFGATADYDQLMRYKELGVGRVVAGLPPEGADTVLPLLDKWAELIRKVNG